MGSRGLAAGVLAVVMAAGGMAQDLPEIRMFVADRGNASSGGDGAVLEMTLTGGFLSQLPAFGSGPIRGVAVADNGDVYVARGNAINRFDAAGGFASGSTFALGTMAQDVAIHPQTGNVWCSFGVTAANAMILELDTTGATVSTITDPLLEHPRSIAFDLTGANLYVANVVGNDVLHVDPLAVPPVISTFAGATDLGMGFIPTHVLPSRVQDEFVTVVGDYGGNQEILTVIGTPGAVTVTTLLDYSTTSDLLAPAGGEADSYGNVYVCGRDGNMGQVGIYVLREDTGNRPVPFFTSSQLVNPVGVAFRRTRLDVMITSADGTDMDGTPQVLNGDGQPTMLGIDINAPDFPSAGYAIFFSAFVDPVLMPFICNDRPTGTGISLGSDGDPRFLPIDDMDPVSIGDTVNIIVSGGAGPFTNPCPGGQAGMALRFLGGLDALGQANAELIFPELGCLGGPTPDELLYGFTVVVLDGVTLPIGIGAMSSFASCLALKFGPP